VLIQAVRPIVEGLLNLAVESAVESTHVGGLQKNAPDSDPFDFCKGQEIVVDE